MGDDDDEFVEKYIEKLSKSSLEKSRPLWDLHLLNAKTSDGADGVVVFRIHHSLGDGTSLMSLLLACTRQVAKPNELPESTELISALAAGVSAKVMVEVTSEVSSSTVALAAAARQTGVKVVCILPELKVNESKQAIEDSGLEDRVEFKTGDPIEVLPNYENVDFSVVDCKMDDNKNLLETLDVNPKNSVVVTNNLPMVDGRKSVEGHMKGVEKKAKVRSIKHHIGNGMEITMIGKNSDVCKRNRLPRFERKKSLRTDRSNWIAMVDEKSGEEHIYRIPKTESLISV